VNLAELQQAVFDRLDGLRATTLSSVQAVYTVVPQSVDSGDDSVFPYITIGPLIAEPDDTKDDNGLTVLVDVHTWSRSQSALTWRTIADAVYDALQRHSLSVTGANVIECRYDGGTEFMDPDDGKTWHTVQTFRVLYYLT
jgi:hypothetical protein